jgi:hypothetical protein
VDDLFKAVTGHFGIGKHTIEVNNIGVVMLAMVEVERVSRNMGLKGVFGVRQLWKFESHE